MCSERDMLVSVLGDGSCNKSCDLLDDVVFAQVVSDIANGAFTGAVLLPPSNTFACRGAQEDLSTVVPAYRGELKPDLYGLRSLNAEQKNFCRRETLMVARSAEIARALSELGVPWVLGSQFPIPGVPSLFNLDEIKQLTTGITNLIRSDVSIGTRGSRRHWGLVLVSIRICPYPSLCP